MVAECTAGWETPVVVECLVGAEWETPVVVECPVAVILALAVAVILALAVVVIQEVVQRIRPASNENYRPEWIAISFRAIDSF